MVSVFIKHQKRTRSVPEATLMCIPVAESLGPPSEGCTPTFPSPPVGGGVDRSDRLSGGEGDNKSHEGGDESGCDVHCT